MDDRELLIAAARAAGMQHKWHANGLLVDEHCGVWNPLTDDAQALRLAVALNLDMTRLQSGIAWDDADRYAATRRAIVRAAAALASPKPQEQDR